MVETVGNGLQLAQLAAFQKSELHCCNFGENCMPVADQNQTNGSSVVCVVELDDAFVCRRNQVGAGE